MSTTDGTGQGQGQGTGSGQGGAEEAMDLLIRAGQQVCERYAERAKHNLALARNREYGLDSWLDDVRWFWSGVADDATTVVDALQGLGRRPDQK